MDPQPQQSLHSTVILLNNKRREARMKPDATEAKARVSATRMANKSSRHPRGSLLPSILLYHSRV
jgi:hypothetical protein